MNITENGSWITIHSDRESCRRTQTYDPMDRIYTIPHEYRFVPQRLKRRYGIGFKEKIDQMIATDYPIGRGVNAHVDRVDIYNEPILMLSLNSDCIMYFGESPILFPRRSLLVLEGDARYLILTR